MPLMLLAEYVITPLDTAKLLLAAKIIRKQTQLSSDQAAKDGPLTDGVRQRVLKAPEGERRGGQG